MGKKSKKQAYQLIGILKRTSHCQHCGVDGVDLDFHHRNPKNKIKEPCKLAGKYSLRKVIKEIEKCDLICKTCHTKINKEVSNNALHTRKMQD